MDKERIDEYLLKEANSLSSLDEEEAAALAERMKRTVLSSCHAPVELTEKQINTYVSLFMQETGKRKNLAGKPFLPPFVHRLPQHEIEERTARHARAAELIATQAAKDAIQRRRIALEEQDLFFSADSGFSGDDLLEFTRLFAGVGPAAFSELSQQEKEAAFLSFIEKQNALTSSIAKQMSPDELLTFASAELPYMAFGRFMTAEKLAVMAEQFGVHLSDGVLGRYEETCEPLLSSLGVCHDRVYRMANAYYKEYDVDAVATALSLSSYSSQSGQPLPSDNYLKAQFKKTGPDFGGFLGLESSLAEDTNLYPVTEDEDVALTGRVAACFDSWAGKRFGAKAVEFYDLRNPDEPITDRDACTEALKSGAPLAALCDGRVTLFTCDGASGQVCEIPAAEIPDLTNEKEARAFVASLMSELCSVQTSSPSASREFKEFDRCLRRLADTAVHTETFRKVAEETAKAAREYVKLKAHTDKAFNDKTYRRLALAKQAAATLAPAAGVCLLEDKGRLPDLHTHEETKQLARTLREKHDARPAPGFFSGAYRRAYRAESEWLDALQNEIQKNAPAPVKEEEPLSPEEQQVMQRFAEMENAELQEQLCTELYGEVENPQPEIEAEQGEAAPEKDAKHD